jgi:type II secretory pathway pseudopilin PulG
MGNMQDRFSKGFSLIQILVAIGLMGLLGYIASTAFVNMSRQTAHMFRKSELVDLRNQLMLSLSNPQTCACHLAADNASRLTEAADSTELDIDSTDMSGAQTINLKALFDSCDPNSKALEVGQRTSAGSVIAAIKLINLKPVFPSQTNPAEWRAQWTIELADPLYKPLKIEQRVFLDTTTPAATRKIKACASANLASMQCSGSYANPPTSAPPPPGKGYAVIGFTPTGEPICSLVDMPPPTCYCCAGAAPPDYASSISNMQQYGCGAAGCYRSQNCRWWRTDNPNAAAYGSAQGVAGQPCSIGSNDSSVPGRFVRDCADGKGWNSSTNSWTDL